MQRSRTSGPATRAAVVPVAVLVATGLVAAGALVHVAGGSSAAPTANVGLAAAVGDPIDTPQGLQILGNSCESSDQQAHTGFQEGPRCVPTSFGEVGPAEDNPSLLITRAPSRVRVGQQFTLRVSTRNLVRDRFLGAAAGGYYLESSFLTGEGLQRGHFHTACRMLDSTRRAPDPAPVPAFFKATEDGGGGSEPDTVEVVVSGLPRAGLAQCAVWAGDGSHRIPMMQRANQTPAFDVVRILVRPARPSRQQPAPAPVQPSPAPSPAPSAEPSPAPSVEPSPDPSTDPSAEPAPEQPEPAPVP